MKNKYKLDQTQKPLYDRLLSYSNSGVTPFDVPGHKMGKGMNPIFVKDVGEEIFKMDINSSKQVDFLNYPTGVIKESEELAADAYGADQCYFLVNGSTSGVQNMILATVGPKEKIIMPRNVHKSAINALILSGATPVFMQPYVDPKLGIAMGVPFEEAKAVIDEHIDAKAIMLVNPTYFGITQDLERIINYAHDHNMIVLVDESHGAHFNFNERLPQSAIFSGADFATMSMHKTGGSFTQSSLLLMNTERVDKHHVRSCINLMQSSSASYLLMASLDMARHYLANDGVELLDKAIELGTYAREQINRIKGLYCVTSAIVNGDSVKEMDATKLIIDVADLGLTGFEVNDILKEEYNIQVELGETNVILAIISFADTKASVDTLINALKEISGKYQKTSTRGEVLIPQENPALLITPRGAYYHEKEQVALRDSEDLIAGESLMIYPPGIPLLIPGEQITREIIDYYYFLVESGVVTLGSENDKDDIYIEVLC